MPRRRDERNRVHGPYWIASKEAYRVVVLTPNAEDPKERRTARYYREESEANEAAVATRRLFEQDLERTVGDAITAYERHLEESGTIGYRETVRRVRAFFPDHALPFGRITPERCKGYYAAFRDREKGNGDLISVSYHRATLINARSLFTWCIDQGWAGLNPLAEVKGVGRRKSGKRKPTGDELAKLYAHCWPLVEAGDINALAVMMILSMALRSADITRRLVRDVDMDGTQLIVESGKSEKTNEPRIIPEKLQPYVRALAAGRPVFEPLFKTPYTEAGHHTHRWLQQVMVKFCEEAEIPYVTPHSLKGASGTVLAKRGAAANLIMDHLSHEEQGTTFRHYVDRSVVDGAQAAQAFKVIAGGRQ